VPADDQQDVVGFLSRPDTYGLRDGEVRRIDTHISIVWLAGNRAIKLKRAVRFDYVDYSTLELRRVACEAEIRLNRRTAPGLYLGVRAITREHGGSIAFDGQGTVLDWVVEMARFDEDTLFDRLAARGALEPSLMDDLAAAIADLHRQAEIRTDHGGAPGMAWVVDGNAGSFDTLGPGVLDLETTRMAIAETKAALDQQRQRLEERRRGGWVRVCHGDLHLRNICLMDGRPTLFDAVEFNDEISCVDILYDVAFLLMDLWYRGLRSHANLVLNGYLARTADIDGLALMPLYLSCRAAIRSKTSLAASRVVPGEEQQRTLHQAARAYLALARAFLKPSRACLVAIGGFSGAGKSTLAHGLAPALGGAPGALVLRSDVIRKSLLGVDPLTRLGQDAYGSEVTGRVYETMAEHGAIAIRAGHAVIADAVHGRGEDRERIEAVAREAGVPFVGIWLEGSAAALASRLRARANDPSDATPDVLARQLESGVRGLGWHRVDATGKADEVRAKAEALLPPESWQGFRMEGGRTHDYSEG
jgi:aminoglycoside phosphotransferase family enzyme/predicted kinase